MNFYFKKCSRCSDSKLRTEFYKRLNSKDGLNSECKECTKRRQREYHARKKSSGTLREEMLLWRYAESDCWLRGKLVMKGGKVLNTKLARDWWRDKVKTKEKQVIVEEAIKSLGSKIVTINNK